MRHDARRDGNEKAIVDALEAQGFHVDRVSGKGIPDLIVSKAGQVWFVEIKMPKAKLKPTQVAWRAAYRGPAPILLRSVEDALKFQLLAMETGERKC